RARAVARAQGWFDALLINERDEVTEGAVTNVFLRLDGGWVTPPLSSGVLPGVGRRDFFLNVGAIERPIFKEDLKRAQEICLTNAVMGTQPAVWSGQ
ncbi:MAG: aminodeoxychorismate synthase component I, partial [Bacteroidetes Order II. Incertae sedis bacterium]|nr:aminodeoxychorismate synthase component I [Bacteroidetes Order II. bacterium]